MHFKKTDFKTSSFVHMFDTVWLEESSTTEPRFPCTFLYSSYCVYYGKNENGMGKFLLFKDTKFCAFCCFYLT